MMVRQAHHERG